MRVRQESHIRVGIVLEARRHAVIDYLTQHQKPDHIRPEYRHGDHLEQLVVDFHDRSGRSLAVYRLFQGREEGQRLADPTLTGRRREQDALSSVIQTSCTPMRCR